MIKTTELVYEHEKYKYQSEFLCYTTIGYGCSKNTSFFSNYLKLFEAYKRCYEINNLVIIEMYFKDYYLN